MTLKIKMSNITQKKNTSNISTYYFKSMEILNKKYLSFENSYELICINNLIYTENCRIVARFKDFLYYDDSSEFLKKYYTKDELPQILARTFDFYAKYCKVFPNYMILPENLFLYKNLRKKQKMIDKLNEIKREEEENRKHLKLKKNKENENDYILFNKKVQESIEKYKPSLNQSTILMDYINFNSKDNNGYNKNSKILNDSDSKNSKIISLNFINTNYNVNNSELNDLNISDLTVISLINGINSTPNKNKEKNKISFTPKKKKMLNTEDIRKSNNGNKKFISHYPNMKKTINKLNNNNINNINSTIKKKEIKKNITNINSNNSNNTSTAIKKIKNNISQSKTSNQLFISSLQKKNKDIQNKTKYIKKRKLFFTDTEKMISNKKSIYNYNNKKLDKNSHSINTNKYKKKLYDINYQSVNPSISPPNNKINSIKLKLIDDMIIKKNKNLKSNIVMYNKSKNIIKNNLSYNNNINSFQNTDQNISCKINADLNKKGEKISNNQNNNNCPKTSVKEIINKYKNILKNRKSNHFSHDINKNNLFLNKKIYSNLTENNNNIQKNKANKKNRKTEVRNNYISPVNKKNIFIFSSGIKTPLNHNTKYNNKFDKKIAKTKQISQPKIQNYIKKTLDKNK